MHAFEQLRLHCVVLLASRVVFFRLVNFGFGRRGEGIGWFEDDVTAELIYIYNWFIYIMADFL
jgi:hypothetical protein